MSNRPGGHETEIAGSLGPWIAERRRRLRHLVEARWFHNAILTLIVVNALTLGLETWPAAMALAGDWIWTADRLMLAVFTVEVGARLVAYGLRFFRDPWNVFDFVVIGLALVPATTGFSVLRALRVLRVLRIISAVPRMRMVVQALLSAIPGLGSIVALLALIFYVAAVMATKMFGAAFPEWFGSIPASLYSLFQIMTLESWSMGIVRPIMEVFPYAWAFFVPFILIATFTMLNLFIAVVVSAMQSGHEADHARKESDAHDERQDILAELRSLRDQVSDLQRRLGAGSSFASPSTQTASPAQRAEDSSHP